jgi:hypothetical protein
VTLIIPKKVADGLAEEDRLRTFDQPNLHPALEKERRVSVHSPPDDLALEGELTLFGTGRRSDKQRMR